MNYLFLNSYFNAIEKNIADDIDLDRMINSESTAKACEVLQDTDYGKWVLESDKWEDVFKKEKEFFRKELFKMGAGELTDLFSLKADITNLRIFLKETLFNLDSGQLLDWGKSEEELRKEFEEEMEEAKKKESPSDLDDYITRVYLERLKRYAGRDKAVKNFISDYLEIMDNLSGEERDEKLKNLEREFIALNSVKNEGRAPLLAFFMKKWLAEKRIKAIIGAKEMSFSPKEIKKIIEDIRAL